MAGSLKNKVVSGLFWSFAESFLLQFFSFVVGVILARLLMPSDYGLIAMAAVFLTISNILIDGGMQSALIRKKNVQNWIIQQCM